MCHVSSAAFQAACAGCDHVVHLLRHFSRQGMYIARRSFLCRHVHTVWVSLTCITVDVRFSRRACCFRTVTTSNHVRCLRLTSLDNQTMSRSLGLQVGCMLCFLTCWLWKRLPASSGLSLPKQVIDVPGASEKYNASGLLRRPELPETILIVDSFEKMCPEMFQYL